MPRFTCSICGETEDDCNCKDCIACGETFASESLRGPCDTCDRCRGCGCTCCSICYGDSDHCGCCSTCENSSTNCECCPNCRLAPEDCECHFCSGCNETVYDRDWACSSCDHCNDCGCDCEDEDEDTPRPARPATVRTTPVYPLPPWALTPSIETVAEPARNTDNDWIAAFPLPVGPPIPPQTSTTTPPNVKCHSCRRMKPYAEMCRKASCGGVECLICCGHAICEHTYASCDKCHNCSSCCVCPRCPTCLNKHRARCEVCSNCLTCCTCVRCNRHVYDADHASHIVLAPETVCAQCTMCESYCKCPKCLVCEEKKLRECATCDSCRNCCVAGECGAIARDGEYIQFKAREVRFFDSSSIPFTVDGGKQRRLNPDKRHISVELETNVVENRERGNKLHKALEKWSDAVVRDGSIGSGREINTNPSSGAMFLEHIRDLCDGFEDLGLSANESCGMHVHINAKDITTFELRRVIILYEKIERALFGACHPDRLNNQYALKCGHFFSENLLSVDPKSFKQEMYGALYNGGKKFFKPAKSVSQSPADRHHQLQRLGQQIKSAASDKYRHVRYRALNLHSYFLRGSIEFRHHEGTTDYNTITGFARVCAEIVSKANSLTETQIKALPRNSRRAMMAILPKDLQDFIVGAWAKNDAIKNAAPQKYKTNYQEVWGL